MEGKEYVATHRQSKHVNPRMAASKIRLWAPTKGRGHKPDPSPLLYRRETEEVTRGRRGPKEGEARPEGDRGTFGSGAGAGGG